MEYYAEKLFKSSIFITTKKHKNMERIRLAEAIEYASAKKGRKIRLPEIGAILYPDSSIASRQINASKIATGTLKRVKIDTVKSLCEFLEVDANFLFDVKPMEK